MLLSSLPRLAGAALAAATNVVAQSGWEGVGTWSTGGGQVLTGPSFGVPYNESFVYPSVAGYSFSFTDDGYFEQAQFTWNSNNTDHRCIEAVVIWQHGTYKVLNNGSITTDPTVFKGDGRIQVQNACGATSSNIYYYSNPGLYKTWAVSEWRNKTMLRLGSYDGSLLPRMYKISDSPRDYMFPSTEITNSSSGTYTLPLLAVLWPPPPANASAPLHVPLASKGAQPAAQGQNQHHHLVGGLNSPILAGSTSPASRHTSPKVASSGGFSPQAPFARSTSSGVGASLRTATGQAGVGSPKDASPRLSSSQRASAAFSSERRHPNLPAPPAEPEEGGALRSPKSSNGSLRRKPPPPLEFAYEPSLSPRSRPRGDSSASSEDEVEQLQEEATNPSPSKDEERDTLSGLIHFDPSSSPVLNTAIPSARLHLSNDVVAENDDTLASLNSYLSSSTSGSSSTPFDTSAPRPYAAGSYAASSSAYGNGLGLGLPFSMSASAHLSSLGTSPTSTTASSFAFPPPPIPSTSPTTSPNPYRSPAARSDASPVADRGQLIGLGELATPRWTSGPLERRWGVPETEERRQSGSGTRARLEDKFDVVGSYGLEHEPMPPARGSKTVVESPTISRPAPRYSAGRPTTVYDSPNRPFAGANANLYPPSLMPSSASSATISTDASPAALLNFGGLDTTPQSFGPLDFSMAPPTLSSPVYSLDAVSVADDSPKQRQDFAPTAGAEDPLQQTVRKSHAPVVADESSPAARRVEVPRRRDSSRRKSFGAAASAPNSAAPGQTWTTAPGMSMEDVIGLGFEHEIPAPGAIGGGGGEDAAAAAAARRRVSSGSATSASTKRSSTRSMSMDAKTSAKQHRRTSTGKGSFAHLPPSPAASSASHVFTSSTSGSTTPALPPLAAFPLVASQPASSSSAAPPLPTSSVSTPSARTPDHARLSRHSFHSHHSSPSIVAASILRHTRDLEGVDVDIEHAAAADEGTAAALAKLDGLSSPRMSRISSTTGGSGGTSGGETRSRKSSRAEAPPANVRRDSSQSVKRRARSSTGESAPQMAKEIEKAFSASSSEHGALSRSTSTNVSPVPPTPALPSPTLALSASSSGAPFPRSPLSASTSQMPSSTARPPPSNRLAASASNVTPEIPFTASTPSKRGSSSSASMTAGAWTIGSHDSTSATSIGTRSTASKYRRSSAGSDVSSTHSGVEGARPPLDRGDSAGEAAGGADIPPVPPLPKDWETYRPTATSASSAQHSPRPDFETRRPSEASSFNDSTAQPSPFAPPMQPTRTTSSSGKSVFEASQLPVATASAAGSARRKWSISSAFHKAIKSPKATSSAVKESTSYQDLQSAAGRRERTLSFGQHLADTALPRRLAASTSDIASLSSGKSGHEPSSAANTGSLGRSSIRSGKIPSSARTRTSSQSSASTTRTAQTSSQFGVAPSAGASSMPPPSVVATSPGRSRSSLINPRRTPSGIPFFSRKSSTASDISATTPSPNTDKGGEFEGAERHSGRKSILGLNFLRSGGSKRDKEKGNGPLSPPSSSKRSTFSSSTASTATASSSRQTDSFGSTTDEFGRRASLATPKSGGILTRKRGKTFGSMDKGDVFGGPSSQPVQLPPLQVNPLPPSTARRVDSMSSSGYAKPPPSTSSNLLQTPRTRTSKLQDSLKVNLPTIAGSPSTHALGNGDDNRSYHSTISPSTTPPPLSHTPTKIPRLRGTSSQAASPRTSPVAPSTSSRLGPRRMSSHSSTHDTASQLSASISSTSPNPQADETTSEFGFVNREPGLAFGEKTLTTRRRLEAETVAPSQIPRSRSTTSGVASLSSSTRSAKEPASVPPVTQAAVPRAGRRPSTVEEEKRTPSASSSSRALPRSSALSASTSRLPSQQTDVSSSSSTVTGLSSSSRKPLVKHTEPVGTRRASVPASMSSTSESFRSATKSQINKVVSRVPKPASVSGSRLSPSTTDSGRSSSASGTFGPDDDKIKGDEEMAAYARRQIAKQVAKGVAEEKVRKMFEFPDPTDPLPPLSPEDALSLYSRYLSPYEKEEILEYQKVYFVGPNCDKKAATKDIPTNNFGFDDDRGDYLLVMHDHIQFRYEVIDVLGKGSFGQVLQCRDHKTGEMVAIKIIRNKKRFHHQALVEIKVLENLVKWDPEEKHYVIRMVESFTFRGHLCIVTELLSINLYELVKANSFAGFSTTLIRRFATQILKSLILLYHHRVVHCDLKPENILLRHPAKSGIKVIDFGSSCFENEKVYTYIQSRFYRSPEVILGMNYHMGIDMWSLGCILAEMYTGYPIFPGENEQEQLACIMEVQGLPDRYLIDKSSRKRLFFDSTGAPRPVVNSKGRRRRPASKTLEQVLRCQDELFVDFIAKCLTWDPDRRMKPEKALRHPWIAGARSLTPASIPSRSSRTASNLSSSTSSRTAGASSHSSSPSISTPLKKLPSQASTSTAPVPRTRTTSYSSSLANTASGARLGSKASLGLPPSSRYSSTVKN
ncbi:hypothetical protein JCM8097_009519 [Rhodosporidiobolus ruineniae]